MEERLLIVDDNVDAADMLLMLLKRKGYRTTAVYNGADALAAARRQMPNVVLLDLGMPVMDGFQVAEHIRKLPEGDEVILIALTGWGLSEDRARTAAAGFDHHLVKPVTLKDLNAVITRCLGEAPAERL